MKYDKILIQGLEVFAHHGFYEEEQKLGQKFVLSLELEVDTEAAAYGDDLDKTLNYGMIAREAVRILQEKNHKLIETAAQETASSLLIAHPLLHGITVKLEKPWAPVGLPLQSVGVEIYRGWHEVYLSVGSNLGDRADYLNTALDKLKNQRGVEVTAVSDWIETAPYGVTDQPSFLNGCIALKTILSPDRLLSLLQKLEKEAKRERVRKWGPRTLDIDILMYDDLILGSKTLILPHPEMEKRLFVLEPLAKIAPWLRHPVTKLTVSQMLTMLQEKEDKPV